MSLFGSSKRVLLCICDGMGHSENRNKNAVYDAKTPELDSIYQEFPFTQIIPGGEEVGLPKGVAGNSEVGHLNLGAGRPVRQDLVRINEAIEKDTLKDMKPFQDLVNKAKTGNKRLHLFTLLSDGGVHAHIDHLKAVLEILKTTPEIQVYLHAFMDGRDTQNKNGIKYIKDINSFGGFEFASMQGRSIGMDRDRRWEKIEKAYNVFTGSGKISKLSPVDYINLEYDQEIFDEFITPVLFDESFALKNDDTAFFLNFRPDRAKQISLAFCDGRFPHFDNEIRPGHFLCMSPYIDEELPNIPILFNREKIKGTICEYLSSLGHKQLKIAETEKYAHVTYFFNGGLEKPFEGEERLLINSPRDIATYDESPAMSAYLVLNGLLDKLDDESISFYVVNFANPDMVGHTGKYQETVEAMQVIDDCIGQLKKKCLTSGISLLITADHGNSDQMVYSDGSPHTSHSNSNVPFALVQAGIDKSKIEISENMALKDVAPTVLHLLGIEKNALITGNTIFK
jgi:2,3-bisphosphoglycerate-independent phosphoglycerate mutase